MSSKIYDIMNSAIISTDLLHSGQQLIHFADAVYKEKNRSTIINHFYEQLYLWAFSSLNGVFTNKKNYFICDELNSVKMFLGLRIPVKTSTVKSINGIRAFGEYVLLNYTKPIGKCISETSLKDILQYLDKEYNFSTKVFSDRKSYFIIIKNSHKEYNSECLIAKSKDDIINYFFLYHMNKKESINPEAVLFHELGHALHAKRFRGLEKLPKNIIEILHDICFPDIKSLDVSTQNEMFADVLSIGLMYQTPFDKYNLFKEHINRTQQKMLKMLVKELIDTL